MVPKKRSFQKDYQETSLHAIEQGENDTRFNDQKPSATHPSKRLKFPTYPQYHQSQTLSSSLENLWKKQVQISEHTKRYCESLMLMLRPYSATKISLDDTQLAMMDLWDNVFDEQVQQLVIRELTEISSLFSTTSNSHSSEGPFGNHKEESDVIDRDTMEHVILKHFYHYCLNRPRWDFTQELCDCIESGIQSLIHLMNNAQRYGYDICVSHWISNNNETKSKDSQSRSSIECQDTISIDMNRYIAALYNWLGFVYNGRECFSQAIQKLNTALLYQPDYLVARTNRAYSFRRLNQKDVALSEFSALIEARPDYAEFYIDRGDLYEEKGLLERAITDYSRAISLGTRNPLVHHNRSVAFVQMGLWVRSLPDASLARSMDPSEDEYMDTYDDIVTHLKNSCQDSLFSSAS